MLVSEKLGIPSQLDPQDMFNMEATDKFSIVPYVSQYHLHDCGMKHLVSTWICTHVLTNHRVVTVKVTNEKPG